MDRLTLERHQVWIYLAAIILGLFAGKLEGAAPLFAALLSPSLILLLFVTFVQVPLLHLREAFLDYRFAAAVWIGNFIVVPLLAWGLVQFIPADPVLRLGVLVVLLVPCTDWFMTFTALGGGCVSRALAITPMNLVLQLLLLPLYLWLMLGEGLVASLEPGAIWPALAIVLLPLGAAALLERWIEARPERSRIRERMAWWPVPILAVVVFLIAAAQGGAVRHAFGLLPEVIVLFAVFLLLAALVGKSLANLMGLPVAQGRTLAFSLGTRNSFVVLPLVLALPAGWEIAAVVVVAQSLVELLGMLFYLWWIPRLFPNSQGRGG